MAEARCQRCDDSGLLPGSGADPRLQPRPGERWSVCTCNAGAIVVGQLARDSSPA